LLTCWSHRAIFGKIKYIYDNPVDEGLVFRPEKNVYNSTTDYSGKKGMIGKRKSKWNYCG